MLLHVCRLLSHSPATPLSFFCRHWQRGHLPGGPREARCEHLQAGGLAAAVHCPPPAIETRAWQRRLELCGVDQNRAAAIPRMLLVGWLPQVEKKRLLSTVEKAGLLRYAEPDSRAVQQRSCCHECAAARGCSGACCPPLKTAPPPPVLYASERACRCPTISSWACCLWPSLVPRLSPRRLQCRREGGPVAVQD